MATARMPVLVEVPDDPRRLRSVVEMLTGGGLDVTGNDATGDGDEDEPAVGHERGAFTGAQQARRGAFAQADRGVLFLDEIGELPGSMQPELLRVLEEGTFKPLGSSQWQKTDFRLVCATNRDLDAMERAGRFRRDLLSRLSAVTVRLPALAERVADIPLLARHFLAQLPSEGPTVVDPAVEGYLAARNYPGNVRELRQLVTQIAIRRVAGAPVTVGMVPEPQRPHPDGGRVNADGSRVDAGPEELRVAVLNALRSSGVRYFDALADAAQRAPHKLIFGSDGPLLHPGVELEKIRQLHLSPALETQVTSATVATLIGL